MAKEKFDNKYNLNPGLGSTENATTKSKEFKALIQVPSKDIRGRIPNVNIGVKIQSSNFASESPVQLFINGKDVSGKVESMSLNEGSLAPGSSGVILVKLNSPIGLAVGIPIEIWAKDRLFATGSITEAVPFSLKPDFDQKPGIEPVAEEEKPTENVDGYNGLLGNILAARPLILFPLRLETSFCHKNIKGKNQKQLRVRIIPDEIMLDYNKNAKVTKKSKNSDEIKDFAKLTQEEINDGKFFWTQWFIASGCEKREKEAWDILCSKYPLNKTAWICDSLRPINYEDICKDGKYYYRRPYVYRGDGDASSCIEDIEDKCKRIYDILETVNYDENDVIAEENEETAYERRIRTGLGKINSFIFDIESELQSCQYIVDYLYDTVHEAFLYLQSHLQTIDSIYNNRSQMKEARYLELWDIDYSILTSVIEKTNQFLKNLEDRRLTLSEMVKRYLDEEKIEFPDVEKRDVNKPIIPVCRCLPKKFVMIAEVANENKDIVYAFSKDVKASEIQMGFSLDSNKVDEGVDLDSNGELALGSKMKWLTDYEAAEKLGMAITVNVDENIKEFRYIYVVGVQTSADSSILRDLFYGHNYVNSNMRILKAGTPTNIVDKKYVDEEDSLKEARYKIEVDGGYRNFSKIYATEDEIKELFKPIQNEKEHFITKYSSRLEQINLYRFKCCFDELFKQDKKGELVVDKDEIYPNNLSKYNELERIVLENVKYDEEKEQIKKDLEPLKKAIENLSNWFFDESDYDARKISYLFKGGKNTDCYDKDFLNCWSSVIDADSRQSYNAKIAYTAIWNFLIPEEKSSANLSPRSRDNQSVLSNSHLKDFFVNHVRARGNFAAFRIDNMPYGILPISDFVEIDKILEKSTDEKDILLSKLLKALIKLAKKWRIIRNDNVQWSEVLKGENVQKKYLEMAGQSPYSNSFTERVVVDFPNNNAPNSSLDNRTIFDFLEKELCKGIPVADLYKEFWGITEGVEGTYNVMFDTLVDKVVDALNANYNVPYKDINRYKQDAKLFVAEFLDLFTYRIDAWFLGILDYFFHKNIRKIDTGCVGAFGWAFNLKEDASKKDCVANRAQVIKDMELNGLTDSDTLLKAPSTAHFITAPSIQHVLTAAVLRSSYFNAKAKNKAVNSQMCVNLSSTRVRQALRLVKGVKSGMALSIVLGADFERYLHEAYEIYEINMDAFIYPLRQLFPQVVQTKVEAEDNRANDYIMQVVNAELLLSSLEKDWGWNDSVRSWLDKNYKEKLPWVDQLDGMDDAKRDCLFKIIERLMDTYDALNDLLLSEGVHRLIMGDKASYYAINHFYEANGDGNLPDMQILNIPSEHVVVTHKAGVLLPQGVENPDKVMCHAEPALNAWIENQFGGMENILVFIQRGEGESREIASCSLKDLGVSGIEYMYLSAFDKTFRAYLEARIHTMMNFGTSEVRYSEKISVLGSPFEAGYTYEGEQICLDDNKLRVDAIRGLVGRGRAMNTADWCHQVCEDMDDEDLIDIENLKDRFSLAFANLEYLKKDIEDWFECAKGNKALDDSLVARAYTLLCDCFESGLINAFNQYDTSAFLGNITQTLEPLEYDDICKVQQELYHSVEDALTSLKKKMDEAKNMVDTSETVDSYIDALKTLTLSNFKVCYKFKTELVKDLFMKSSSNPLKSGLSYYKKDDEEKLNEIDFSQWQDEVSEVREGMKLMHQLSMTQLALDHELDKVSILQTSIPDGAETTNIDTTYKRWLGLAVKDESELRDADSLVLYNSSAYMSGSSDLLSGFVFDSWIEYIPYKKHDAGFAFHNDWPDNEAPQTVLVAWHPKVADLHDQNDGGWSLKMLLQIIRTTRFMMMNRAVDPDHLYGDEVMSKCVPVIPVK